MRRRRYRGVGRNCLGVEADPPDDGVAGLGPAATSRCCTRLTRALPGVVVGDPLLLGPVASSPASRACAACTLASSDLTSAGEPEKRRPPGHPRLPNKSVVRVKAWSLADAAVLPRSPGASAGQLLWPRACAAACATRFAADPRASVAWFVPMVVLSPRVGARWLLALVPAIRFAAASVDNPAQRPGWRARARPKGCRRRGCLHFPTAPGSSWMSCPVSRSSRASRAAGCWSLVRVLPWSVVSSW